MKNQLEKRMLATNLEVRSLEDGEAEVIEGYALKYEHWSDELGWYYPFREKLAQGCLDHADMSNVVALFNHDESQILGRSGVNVELLSDNIGLHFRIAPNNSTLAKDVLENVRSGIISQCSFAFTVPDEDGAEDWQETEAGTYERTINKIDKLYDVSLVTTPAYPDTEVVVGTRSKEMVEEIRNNPRQKEIDRMLQELDKEDILNSL